MNSKTKKKIREALFRLNWHYGRGEVIYVDFTNMTFTRKPFMMPNELRSFKFENGTVYALKHQKKLV